MDKSFDFDALRPYRDEEVPQAISTVVNDAYFPLVVNYLQPGADVEMVKQSLLQIKTVKEFQEQVMLMAICAIVKKTSDGLTSDGFENIDNKTRHIFIANHRDIMLDAALLDVLLYQHGIDTCQITFGSNLMKGDMVVNVGKLNKMFRIIRGGNARDFYRNSLEVSAYMRHVVTEQDESVWIAQRNGRTKNGIDQTEIGVLKMFSLSSEKDFVDNLDELHITPISISYEYEPCDFYKTAELYISRHLRYEKSEGEDFNSILTGIRQKKGQIHLSVTHPITRAELEHCDRKEKKEKFEELGRIIDERINGHHKLFKNNFIAHDLLNNAVNFNEFYTKEDKGKFVEYMKNGLDALDLEGDRSDIEKIFLGIYANQVR